jgi:hypothetical protein
MFQVAFGSDFSQPWTDKELGLRHVKGDGTLGFLVEHSFEAVEIASRNPLHYVSTVLLLKLRRF